MVEGRAYQNFAVVRLDRTPTAPSKARGLIETFAKQTDRIPGLRPGILSKRQKEDTIVAVSEAVTNGVLHGEGPSAESPESILVSFGVVTEPPSRRGNLLVCVGDNNPELPVPVGQSPDLEGGRGLILLDALTLDYGASTEAEIVDPDGNPVKPSPKKVFWMEFGKVGEGALEDQVA